MLDGPVWKTAAGLCLPTVATMLALSFVGMADSYFAAETGLSQSDSTAASAAVGVLFPVYALLQAISFAFGMGAASVISRSLGQKDEKRAERAAVFSFFISLAVGVAISVAGTAFIKPLVRFLGASEGMVAEYACEYGALYMACAPLFVGASVLNILLRSEGKAAAAAVGVISGAAVNIALLPLFVYKVELGVKGIALATLLSQLVSFAFLLSFYVTGKTAVSLDARNLKNSLCEARDILPLGLPSVLRQGFAAASSILLNNIASEISDSALFAASVSSKIFMLFFGVALGIGQGISPLIGFSYSAQKRKRLKKAFATSILWGSVILLAAGVLCMVFSEKAALFMAKDSSEEALRETSRAIFIQCVALPFVPLSIVCNMAYQATGKKIVSSLLASFRQGIFYIPLIIILPRIFGISGMWYAAAACDILTFAVSIPFSLHFIRKEGG